MNKAIRKPNIILVNCDDLGYGDLGCYGSTKNKTPYIDKMAEEGIKLTDFYMASPVCSPSRAAMMTGCYPPRIEFGDFDGRHVLYPGDPYGIHERERTLPQILKEQGYTTKHIGKWHCGDQEEFLPTSRGFDDYYGIPFSNDMGRQTGRPADKFPPLPLVKGKEVVEIQPDQTSLTERYTEEATRFIRENREGPFFLYFAHMYVHVPLFVPRRFLEQSENGGYGGAVEHIDWTMGVIIHELKELGIDEETIVIFTSDNGSRARDEGGSNGPLRGVKGTTWEGGLRVPCIIRWPGSIKENQIVTEMATSMDFLPTLASLAGSTSSGEYKIDGKNIEDLLFEESSKSPHECFFYYMKNSLQAVRCGDWKLHLNREGKELENLYNLHDDPGETENLYNDYPEIVKKLNMLTQQCREDMGDEATGIKGTGIRPRGVVSNPKALTEYDSTHPYMVAMYDLADSEVMCG